MSHERTERSLQEEVLNKIRKLQTVRVPWELANDSDILLAIMERTHRTGEVVTAFGFGSETDIPKLLRSTKISSLEQAIEPLNGIFMARITSAHRTPEAMAEYAQFVRDKLVRQDIPAVMVLGAGGAAHLPGMSGSFAGLEVPTVGIPVESSGYQGVDSFLSIQSMPDGCPIGTIGKINGLDVWLNLWQKINRAVGEWKVKQKYPRVRLYGAESLKRGISYPVFLATSAEVASCPLHLARRAEADEIAIIVDNPEDPYLEEELPRESINILVPRVAPRIETCYPGDDSMAYAEVKLHPSWQENGLIMRVGGLDNAILFAIQLISLGRPVFRRWLKEIDEERKLAVAEADKELQIS